MQSDSANMLSAAFHEAGHAVVSNTLECIPNYIEIHYCGDRNRWEGSYHHTLADRSNDGLTLLKKSAKVAVAGVLAQAKHMMEQRAGCQLTFSGDNDLVSWISLFSNETRSQSTPGKIIVRMKKYDNSGVEEDINGSLYSSADALGFKQCFDIIPSIRYEILINEVLALLDDGCRWNGVDRLARLLVGCAPVDDTDMRKLSHDEITSLLA